MQLFINNWASSLTLPATASAGQLSVPEADAALLIGLGTGDHYLLTLAILAANGLETAWEIVRVTGHAAGVLDVLRAQEGTAALELEAGAPISARLTAATMSAAVQQLASVAAALDQAQQDAELLAERVSALESAAPSGASLLIDGSGNILTDHAQSPLSAG